MIQLGKPVSQVSQILGHKNPELTLKVYTHWFASASSASAMAEAPRPSTHQEAHPDASGSTTVSSVSVAEEAATT